MKARDLIDRLGREEDAFLRREFLAPVPKGGKVRVRIAGAVCEMTARGGEGWCVLRPKSHREAEVVRAAGPADVKRYLALLPRGRLVAAGRHGATWLGIPASAPEKGAQVEGMAPIALAPGLELFQTAVVRFDGNLFLLEGTERHAIAAYLRDELSRGAQVEALHKKGLTSPEKEAYAFQLRLREEMLKPPDQRRLENALEMAGAELVSWVDGGDYFSVTFRVDGQPHTSVVSKSDLTLVSAGICLDDRDGDFDLTSFVGVLRQARRQGHE